MRHIIKAAVAVSLLTGCAATLEDSHGFVPTDEDLADVAVGLDTKDTIGVLLGQPGSTGVLSQDAWFYVASDYETFAWRRAKEVDRQVVSISFDERDIVTNIERFGLEEGRPVVLERRVTETGIAGISILRQLFANFGVLTADQFLSDQ